MKVTITGSIALRRYVQGSPRSWTVQTSPWYLIRDVERGIDQIHSVEKWARTDGASVPRALWWFAPPLSGRPAPAAVLHDVYYATHMVSKEVADLIFYHGMLNLGVNKVKALAMYLSVKWFGGRAWNHDRVAPLTYPEHYLYVYKSMEDTTT